MESKLFAPISLAWGTNILNGIVTWILTSALTTIAGKSFNGKFTEKKNSVRIFNITIADADIIEV